MPHAARMAWGRPYCWGSASERVDSLDHETAHWTGRPVVGFIEDPSIGQSAATMTLPAGHEVARRAARVLQIH